MGLRETTYNKTFTVFIAAKGQSFAGVRDTAGIRSSMLLDQVYYNIISCLSIAHVNSLTYWLESRKSLNNLFTLT